MPKPDRYDILVLGSGESGKYLAWTMAGDGHRTAVVEQQLIGGSCPNIACLPSKNLIYSANVASLARRGAEFGVDTGAARVDMRAVQDRKRRMVADLIDVHARRYEAAGVELIMGRGRFVAPRTIAVERNGHIVRTVTAERVFLNLGTHAAIPDITGLRDAAPLTHVEALDLDRVPPHLVVLGGGTVGLELAQAMRRFGAAVTIVERGSQLAGREDADVATAVLDLFRDEGIDVVLDAEVERVEGRSGETIRLHARTPGGHRAIDGSDLLVAAGRTPNTQDIGLEIAGIALDARGYVTVNERLETTAADVWAMGDCAGSPQFTHVAFDDFRIVRDNLRGGRRTTRGRLIPYCTFTDPVLGRVGLNETDAIARQIPYRLATLKMAAVLRTRTVSEPRGFMKMLIAEDGDRILGFTAFGDGASELVAAVQTAMIGGLPFTALRDAIFTHPTTAEGLTVLLTSVSSPWTRSAPDAAGAALADAIDNADVDQALADSFPASDAPPWTPGVAQTLSPASARARRPKRRPPD